MDFALKTHPAASAEDAELVRGRRLLGEMELVVCSDGSFLLDGGAMFGVVPKTMWQAEYRGGEDGVGGGGDRDRNWK
jgi:hypothetical protein